MRKTWAFLWRWIGNLLQVKTLWELLPPGATAMLAGYLAWAHTRPLWIIALASLAVGLGVLVVSNIFRLVAKHSDKDVPLPSQKINQETRGFGSPAFAGPVQSFTQHFHVTTTAEERKKDVSKEDWPDVHLGWEPSGTGTFSFKNEGKESAKYVHLDPFIRDGRKLICVPEMIESIDGGKEASMYSVLMACKRYENDKANESQDLFTFLRKSLEPVTWLTVVFEDRFGDQKSRSFKLSRSILKETIDCAPGPLRRRRAPVEDGPILSIEVSVTKTLDLKINLNDMILQNIGARATRSIRILPAEIGDYTIEFGEINGLGINDHAPLAYTVRKNGDYFGATSSFAGGGRSLLQALDQDFLTRLPLTIIYIDGPDEVCTDQVIEYDSMGGSITVRSEDCVRQHSAYAN